MTVSKDVLRSTEMLASMDTVSSTIPKNVKRVVGPSTFSSLIGAPIAWQSDLIADKLCWQVLEYAGPAVKNHLNSAGDGELHNCFVVSNELHLLVN